MYVNVCIYMHILVICTYKEDMASDGMLMLFPSIRDTDLINI